MVTMYHVAYSAYALSILVVAGLFHRIVPEPYMDELFHIPQALRYCSGNWSGYDPLLTTPPGLYILSWLLSSVHGYCTPTSLRALNALLLLLLPPLYSSLLHQVRNPHTPLSTSFFPAVPATTKQKGKQTPSQLARVQREREEEGWEGLGMALWPVVGFFGWLYYTDVGGLVAVLACWKAAGSGKWGWSALAGFVSLWFRQTNLVWVFWIFAISVVRILSQSGGITLHNPLLLGASIVDIPLSMLSLAIASIKNLRLLAPVLVPFTLVFSFALAFIYQNGGVVLGDKTNHVPVMHIPQLFYWVGFSAAFMAPLITSPRIVRRAVRGLLGSFRNVVMTLVHGSAIRYCIQEYTIAHPFLLSDNRHLPFYVWRRLINPHPLARYALIPLYLLSGRILLDRISETITLLPSLFFLFSLSTSLVPSPLLEFRYFIIPYLIVRLHIETPGRERERKWRLRLETLGYGAVGVAAVGLFLRGFESGQGVERFMW